MKVAGLFGVVGATLIALVAFALAQSELPEGPDRDLVARTCQTCHGLSVLIGASGQNLASWVSTLDQMEGNGLQVTSDERAKIIEYLATFLGPRKIAPAAVMKDASPGPSPRADVR